MVIFIKIMDKIKVLFILKEHYKPYLYKIAHLLKIYHKKIKLEVGLLVTTRLMDIKLKNKSK